MNEESIALAQLVYRLRTQMEGLQEAVSKHAAQLADLHRGLAQLIQDHLDAEEERAVAQSAPVWSARPGGVRRPTAHAHRVRRPAPSGRLPDYLEKVLQDCWAQHPAALWELGNLWAEWNHIYHRGQPSLTGALNWHDRWLPGVKSRLTDIMQGCRKDRCSKDAPVGVTGWGAR